MNINAFTLILATPFVSFGFGLYVWSYLRTRSAEHMSDFDSKLYDYRRTSK